MRVQRQTMQVQRQAMQAQRQAMQVQTGHAGTETAAETGHAGTETAAETDGKTTGRRVVVPAVPTEVQDPV